LRQHGAARRPHKRSVRSAHRQTSGANNRILTIITFLGRPAKIPKLALNYLGLVKLAFIERYLRLLIRVPVGA